MIILDGRKQDVDALTFSPDGRELAVGGSASHVQLWDLEARKARPVLGTFGPHRAVSFIGNDCLLSAGSVAVRVAERPFTSPNSQLTMRVNYIHAAVTLDGRAVVLVGQFEYGPHLWCLDLPNLHERWARRGTGNHSLFRLAVCPDGRMVCAGATSAHLLDPKTGDYFGTVTSYAQNVPAVAVSPDGGLLAVAAGNQLHLCELPNGRHVGSAHSEGRKHFTDVAFHPSGRFLAASSNHQTVRIFNTSLAEMAAFDWEVGPVRRVAFAPDGMRAAAAGKTGKVVVWDVDL